MAERIFDPTLFRGQGALMTLQALATGHESQIGMSPGGLAEIGRHPIAVFLRWQVNPSLGLPSEPFKVWRRPALPLGEHAELEAETLALPPLGHIVQLAEPCVSITAEVRAGAAPKTVLVIPVTGGVGFESMLGALPFDLPANGSRVFTFQAAHITALVLLNTDAVFGLSGIPLSQAGKIGEWELVETVGLPVDEMQWNDLPQQTRGVPQGLVGAEVDALAAAAQRYARGVNPYGWHAAFPGGQTAPVWQFPTAAELVEDADLELLPMLHDALALAPEEQGAFTREFTIHPPQNSAGDQLDAEDGTAVVAPLTLLQLAASTDPLQAVVLGFGTGYPYEDVPAVHLGAISLFGDPDVSDWDYLVTGLWARGLDGRSAPREYAALIPRPRKVVPPPAPADLQLDFLAHLQPDAPDLPWKAATRLSWERLPFDNLSAVASFAAARHNSAAPGPALPLLQRRPGGPGHVPIGNTTNPNDPERVRQSATDGAFPIPNDPGSVNATYGVATQNLFGIWSSWVTLPFASTQPDPDLVQVTSAELKPVDTGSGTVCPAELVLEIVADWRVRSVRQIDLRGRLFAAATRASAPPAGFPAGLQKSLGGPAVATTIVFAGDVPSFAGGSIVSLDAQGGAVVAPGAAQQSQSRRYRVTVQGFSLDYASTPHVGLALQARLRERIVPGRTSAWTPVPKITYASDPRARPTQVIDIVQLASLPDASGRCHARITWLAVPGAQGYIVYESNETKMLASRNLPAAEPGTSLSTRLTTIKNAFEANPNRNDFSRLNQELLSGTSLDVTLPRGSQVIHLYVVLPLGVGGAEAPWPSGPDADESLIAYAAPRIAEPAPPTIELARVPSGGGFAAQVRVGTRGAAGARPKRIDVYRTRVADAARRLDSMGLAHASVTVTSGPWTVVEEGDAPDDWIASVRGTDHPAGSWSYTWYRAVAWSDDDPLRGLRRGRSRPSPAVPVLVPPAGPPPLSPLVASWPGGALGDVLLDFDATAPVAPTPIGPHVLTAEVTLPGEAVPLLRESRPLQEIVGSEPPTGSGVWRVDDSASYKLIVRRPDADSAASVLVRLADPLGRTSERTYRIEAGPILPLPPVSPIDTFTIAGRGRFFVFSVTAPDEPIGGEPYHVRIALTPEAVGPVIVAPARAPGRTPIIAPRPGRPIVDLGGLRPRGQFRREGGLLVYQSALADIPIAESAETFAVVRQRIGASVSITVIAREPVRAIAVTITTPDGRNVAREARV